MATENLVPFSYDEFVVWYDEHRRTCLQPALESVVRSLRHELADSLDDRQLQRLKVQDGRVKGTLRAWRKLNRAKYVDEVRTVRDVPRVIDDLIGTRITCTNRSDVEVVQRFLAELPEVGEDDYDLQVSALSVVRDSERDYISAPKESGYRAFHGNVVTCVALGASFFPVVCEIQVRSLLQDSWGELTHEDTYKPGSEVPPLVSTLSRRIADLLSTLDDIADDLKYELERYEQERIASESVAGSESRSGAGQQETPADIPDSEVERIASLVRSWIGELTSPVSLAELAWRVQGETEESVAGEWFGFGTFLVFLREVAPNATIVKDGPGYVLPLEGSGNAEETAHTGLSLTGVPSAARSMRRADRSFPLASREKMDEMYHALAEAMAAIPPPPVPDLQYVNALTSAARDKLQEATGSGSRTSLDYIAKGLLFSGALQRPLTSHAIGAVHTQHVLERFERLGIELSEDGEREIRDWLEPTADH